MGETSLEWRRHVPNTLERLRLVVNVGTYSVLRRATRILKKVKEVTSVTAN